MLEIMVHLPLGIILGKYEGMHTPHFLEWGVLYTTSFYELSQKYDSNLSI